MTPESKTYWMVAKLATVHDTALAPLDVLINGEEYKLEVPYTRGYWEDSSAVGVILGACEDTAIKISRTIPFHPLTIKGFKFIPD